MQLKILALGGLSLFLDEKPVTGFASHKAEALLAYLACNQRPQRREVLADLLWDERSQSQALSNLRVLLTSLRQKLGEHVEITRETVALNLQTNSFIDVARFEENLAVLKTEPGIHTIGSAEKVQRAVMDLYRGDLLQGFYITDCRGFNQWLTSERERLHRLAAAGLDALVTYDLNTGDYQAGIVHSSRLVQHDPLMESAHRQMMQLLAFNGQRSAALEQYENCRQALQQELGVEPEAATTDLYHLIRTGKLPIPAARQGSIRGYKLLEQIGAGSFGAVYRANQASVHREVAIKVILPQHADNPDFIRRFETEAQNIARLEHPHIVPLYDYWREPGGAYLVMRLLRGGNLSSLLEQGPMKLEEAAQILDQVASALSAAHQRNLIHRDIKPANILLDEDGQAYLSDFGIALELNGAPRATQIGAIIGSPLYMSPERLLDQSLSLRSDIYSLGVLLYEMLTGKSPYTGQSLTSLIHQKLQEPLPSVLVSRPELPPAIDGVLQRATAVDPELRHETALSLAREFRRSISGLEFQSTPYDETLPAPVNPYKGLQAFEQADAADFFGRESMVKQLLNRLNQPDPLARFLAVVGPSGSGKSSVIRAGLLPALRGGAISGSERWFVVEMIPGAHPMDELEIGLMRISARSNLNLSEQLNRDERGLVRAARICLPTESDEILLVVDQFEEVFTLTQNSSEARRFLSLLHSAVTDLDSCLHVLITLRADFYDRPLMLPNFSGLLQKRTEVVVPLSTEEIDLAIHEPAKRAGIQLENGLEALLIADVTEQPGALPLLQFTLTELFERREGRLLTTAAYQAIGGVMGALSRRADELFNSLEEASQEIARQLFLRLVALGESSEDTRRRVLRSELLGLALKSQYTPIQAPEIPGNGGEASITAEDIESVIEQFGRYRLLTFDHDPARREPTVEIAHEALLKEWPQLHRWLDESRADLRWQHVIAENTTAWLESGRDPSFLLRGSRLQQVHEWSANTNLALTAAERRFIDDSLEARLRQEAGEEEQRRREADLERRSQRILRSLVAVFALAATVAIALSALVFRQSRLAASRELAAAAITNLETNSELGILLAMQAIKTMDTREAQNALHQALLYSRLRASLPAHNGPAYAVAYHPDGHRFASAGDDGSILIWEMGENEPSELGKPVLTIPNPIDFSPSNETTGYTMAFDANGSRLAAISDKNTVKIWDASSGAELLTLTGSESHVLSISFSPDGQLLAAGSDENAIRVWDAQTGKELLQLTRPGGVFSVTAFSPDGKWLVACARECLIWDIRAELAAAQDKPVLTIPYSSGWNHGALAFSPDGSHLALGSNLLVEVYHFEMEGAQPQASLSYTIQAHDNNINSVLYSQDGEHLITASADGKANVWDASTGLKVYTLATDQGMINSAALSASGAWLVTAHQNGTIGIWDLSLAGTQEWFTINGYCGWPSQDGKSLAANVYNDNPTVIDIQYWAVTPERLEASGQYQVDSTNPEWDCPAYSPDLSRFVYMSPDHKAHIWETASESESGAFAMNELAEDSVIFDISPRGDRLATAGPDGMTRIWELPGGKLLLEVKGKSELLYAGVFSPDGSQFAVAGDDRKVRIWDLSSGQVVQTLTGGGDDVEAIAFSPDGKRILTGHLDTTARLWDTRTGQELHTLTGHTGTILSGAFSADGTRVATGSSDGTVKIWRTDTGEEILTLPGSYPLFTPDGKRVLIEDLHDVIRGFYLDPELLMNLASSRLTRSLTQEECRKYLHRETCP